MKHYSNLPVMLADLTAEGLTDVSLNGVAGLSLAGEFRAYDLKWGSRELAVLDRAEGWMHLGSAAHPSGLATPPAGPYFGHLPQAYSLAEARALRAEYSLYHPHVIILGDCDDDREQYWVVTDAEAARLAAAGYDQRTD